MIGLIGQVAEENEIRGNLIRRGLRISTSPANQRHLAPHQAPDEHEAKMRKLSAVLKIAPDMGGRTLIYYDSVLKAVGIDPTTESPDRPLAPGIWEYSVPSLALRGKSRQPLLDACRQIKRILGPTGARAQLFRGASTVPDISCPVETGSLLTVKEPDKGRTIHFARYQAWTDRESRAPAEAAE